MKKPKQTYFNRELSWLEFNQRVLDQADTDRHPLLERVKFLAITASNLDEFFMVRVGGLKLVANASIETPDISGMTAEQQLTSIRERVSQMYLAQSQCLTKLSEELETHGILRVNPQDLTESERQTLLERFKSETVSAVAPIAVDNAIQLSLLRGARLMVCVRLKWSEEKMLRAKMPPGFETLSAEAAPTKRSNKKSKGASSGKKAVAGQDSSTPEFRYVLLALGQSQSRFWTLPVEQGYRYILIEDVVKMFLSEFFDPSTVVEANTLRITRNGDVELVEDKRSDLLLGMEQMLEARQSSDCVRLELERTASRTMRKFLEKTIDVDPADVYLVDGPLELADYFALAGINGFPKLNDEPWPPQEAPDLFGKDVFKAISKSDRMLYHPYQSYDPVVEFVKAAAKDPEVIAIKQTLYRASKDSEIIKSLMTAADEGKNVTAIVELKARFDEARNIYWAKQLEQAGVDVIYGVRGLKTHAKMCLVVRRERTGIKRYIHLATGNYNESTARLYSDVSLFTCDEQIGSDAVHFFNAITGLSVPQTLVKLSAAPINLRETLMESIRIEIDAANSGDQAEITAKINSLADKGIIDALYEASKAGVKVRLNVRGICCLIPGVKGLSENIKVISVVDRMLEHARIFHFRHGGDEKLFISSADWMGRNLDRRVELMTPVLDQDCKLRLMRILDYYFQDNVASTELRPDGSYAAVARKKKKELIRAQSHLHREAVQIFEAMSNRRATVFETYKASTDAK